MERAANGGDHEGLGDNHVLSLRPYDSSEGITWAPISARNDDIIHKEGGSEDMTIRRKMEDTFQGSNYTLCLSGPSPQTRRPRPP